jgi:anti-sigma-K factor RskA
MNKRLSELLPWYANGTLKAEDREWVDRCLAADGDARAELEWYRALQSTIAQSVSGVPPDLGLARTLQRIRADRPALRDRIRGWLGAVGLGPVAALARPIAAIAAVVVIAVQGGVIYSLTRHGEEDAQQIRALRAVPADEGPLLRVNFAPDAREADIRLLLSAVEGSLVGGPGQLGDYYVRVPAGAEKAAANRLKHDRIVAAVEIVPGLPTSY